MPRPCPFVTCRYHLVEIGAEGRAIRRPSEDENGDPDVAALLVELRDTCALDVADRHRELMIATGEPMAHAAVADALGASRETVKKIEAAALASLKVGLRRFLAASPIADEQGDEAAAPDLLSLATDTGYAPLGFE